jgi:hypothetical protein
MKLLVNLGFSLIYAQLWGRLQIANKFSLLTHNSEVPASVSFFNFLMLHQKWPSATRGLARSDCKTNKVLGILLHVGEPLKPIN